jgi:hypothetical protein
MGSLKCDIAKLLRDAEKQGFRIREAKHYFVVFGPHDEPGETPCSVGHTPSSQATYRNFLACLERKGYKR